MDVRTEGLKEESLIVFKILEFILFTSPESVVETNARIGEGTDVWSEGKKTIHFDITFVPSELLIGGLNQIIEAEREKAEKQIKILEAVVSVGKEKE